MKFSYKNQKLIEDYCSKNDIKVTSTKDGLTFNRITDRLRSYVNGLMQVEKRYAKK